MILFISIAGIALFVSIAIAALSTFMLIRNEHVFRYRTSVLFDERFSVKECCRRHSSLPPYNTMLWQLFTWKWDVDEAEVVDAPF